MPEFFTGSDPNPVATQTNIDKFTPEQKTTMNKLLGSVNSYLGNEPIYSTRQVPQQTITGYDENGNPIYGTTMTTEKYISGYTQSPYDASGRRPLTEAETAYQDILKNYPQWAEQSRSWIQDINTPEARQRVMDTMGYDQASQEYNRLWNEAYKPQWERSVAPEVSAQFAGPGYYGTARANALERSLLDTADRTKAETYGKMYDARLAALGGLEAGQVQADLARENLYSQLKAKEPDVAQQYANFSQTAGTIANDPYVNLALKLLGFNTFDTVISSDPGQPGVLGAMTNTFAQFAGSWVGMGANSTQGGMGGGMSGMMSTIESKDNVQVVSDLELEGMLNTLDGIPIVTFNYKDDPDKNYKLGTVTEALPQELVSPDGKMIDTYNLLGFMLGTIKRLNAKVNELEAKVKGE